MIDKALHLIVSGLMVPLFANMEINPSFKEIAACIIAVGLGKEIFDYCNVSTFQECAMDFTADVIGVGISYLIFKNKFGKFK